MQQVSPPRHQFVQFLFVLPGRLSSRPQPQPQPQATAEWRHLLFQRDTPRGPALLGAPSLSLRSLEGQSGDFDLIDAPQSAHVLLHFFAVGGNTPFKRRYIAASA